MIGHLVRRALAEKRETGAINFDTFCRIQEARLRERFKPTPTPADDFSRGECNRPMLPREHFALESRS